MDLERFTVPIEKLRWLCDPCRFEFESTTDAAPLNEFIGQERAIRAIEFGLNLPNAGYNIYVAGLTGTGKKTIVKNYIEKLIREKAGEQPLPALDDWCYLHNFKEPDRPQIYSLPRGMGRKFRERLSGLLTRLREELGRAFSTEDYQKQKKKVIDKGKAEQQQIFEETAQMVHHAGFFLQMTNMGPVVIPLVDGRPMEDKEYITLNENTRKELDAKRSEQVELVQANFEKAAMIQRETAERLQNFDTRTAEFTITALFAPVFVEYASMPALIQFLTDLKSYTLDSLDPFKGQEEPANPALGVSMSQVVAGRNPFLPFQVNVFVDRSDQTSLPVIIEANPNFGNLFGKIERRFLLGGYLSDHTMLKPGAMSLANGGYLLVSARDVLINPGVWMTLKRVIKNQEVHIEDPSEQFGFVATQGMRPEPMPIHVKIILIGDGYLYQLLSSQDEDFWEIFKVKAEFNFEIDRTEKNMEYYVSIIRNFCEECKTKHFDPSGVAKLIEHSARTMADQDKLSARFAQLKEWIEEADYWAAQEKAPLISAKHVQRAIEERTFRHNLIDERMQQMINKGSIMIDVAGEAVGQVNGLAVYSMGDAMFGKPTRITARTYLGRSGVINIEREAELSGPTHNKGVMILSGYLGGKYAQDFPLALSASLCFEQSYEGVDGDSASSTELYAILSSLADIPIRQSIAITGSVNQRGEIQPIGGVNQKIEGFYHTCLAKGLTGKQGVLIPHQNIDNLMLKEEVLEAVKNGMFHVYAVKTVDEGIEVLTGVPAGEKQADGSHPAGTMNAAVMNRLREMAEKLKREHKEDKDDAKLGTDRQAS